MARKPVKKTAAKKPTSKSGKSTVAKRKPAKKASVARKPVTEKEREIRAANAIANSEKKKSTKKRPKKITTPQETVGLLDAIVEGMKEKKGKNILILNLNKIENRVTDYFVICEADSNIHVTAIADSVEDVVMKIANEKAFHSEGRQNGEWVLIDYINIVAHVFLREAREHYNIEGLWGDAEITLIND